MPLFWTSGDVCIRWVSEPEWAVLFKLFGSIGDISSQRITSGVTPLPVYNVSTAASYFPYMHVSAEVGCQIWTGTLDLPLRSQKH